MIDDRILNPEIRAKKRFQLSVGKVMMSNSFIRLCNQCDRPDFYSRIYTENRRKSN